MPLEVPKTRARLSSTITLRALPDTSFFDFSALQAISAFADVPTAQGDLIGAVKKLTRTQTRDIYKRRSLGTFAFEPFQVVPGKINTKLTLERIVLYKTDALMRNFSFLPRHLLFQQLPFIIREESHSPDGQTFVTIYTDCWIATNPITYDIMSGEQFVVQQFEVEVGKMIVNDDTIASRASAIGDGIASLGQLAGSTLNLVKNVKLPDVGKIF